MTTSARTETVIIAQPALKKASKSLWQHALQTIMKDKLACISLFVVVFYFFIALLTFLGVIAGSWNESIGPSYSPPSAEYIFGTDIFGRSVFLKVIKGVETAVAIGIATSLISIFGLDALSTYQELIPKEDGNVIINLFFLLGSY